MLTLAAQLVNMFRDVHKLQQVSLMLLIGCIYVSEKNIAICCQLCNLLASAKASAAHVGMLACNVISSIVYVSFVMITM